MGQTNRPARNITCNFVDIKAEKQTLSVYFKLKKLFQSVRTPEYCSKLSKVKSYIG